MIIPFNDPELFFYRDVSLYIMSAHLSLANKWLPPFVNVVNCVNVTHGLCVGVITDTLVITELRGVRVVQIP